MKQSYCKMRGCGRYVEAVERNGVEMRDLCRANEEWDCVGDWLEPVHTIDGFRCIRLRQKMRQRREIQEGAR